MVGGEAGSERQEQARATLFQVRQAVLGGIERQGQITPAVEVQVQRAVDLLRQGKQGGEPLQRLEAISCLLHRMHKLRLTGRCNAYASSLVRLRREVGSF